jgi:hypothetical protein
MCVCVCVCMCVCVYVCMCVCVYVCMGVWVYGCMGVCDLQCEEDALSDDAVEEPEVLLHEAVELLPLQQLRELVQEHYICMCMY